MKTTRRNVLKNLVLAPLFLGTNRLMAHTNLLDKKKTSRLQYSINAYSFNTELRNGEMTFYDMMEYAANIGLDAIDLTGYYFNSYPEAPSNKELFDLKRKALELGLDISWTGVRNDFATPNLAKRNNDIEMIKNWLQVSSLIGSPIMRIFTGRHKNKAYSKQDVKQWMLNDFKTCAKYGELNGVIVGLQNHDEFLFTSDEIIDVLEKVNSDWFGLILDCGSLPSDDTYREIENLAPYANYYFVKEHIKQKDSTKVPADLKRIAKIIQSSNYRGYVSFESLKEGNTKEIIKDMFSEFKSGLN
ncbi:sugar phosphate isomerase/epimerase family protein [Polaribacter sp.]|uniref:sugar phosphate isomerase/epimerase family protein n=1 Tax=Polaribacter sp. TaxID=1920175 RepID=UPI003F695A7F